jgi:predicted MFS family arabinose efflux permease
MMSTTVFIVVSAEMMPTAVLPMLAADLDVGLPAGGLLISAWAATVVVASFPLTRLGAGRDRPTVIAAALVVVALATLVTASAPTYAVAMGSRLVAAAATGLLWATINVHAVSIVREQSTARATSVVLFGGTIGTVLSLPAGNALAELVGWRVPFLVLGAAALVVAVAVRLALRTAPVLDDGGRTALETDARRPLWPVVAIGALGGVVLAAHFMPFTFVAELLMPASLPAPLLLVVFGAVGVVGVAVVGAVGDRSPGGLVVLMAAMMAVSLAALPALGTSALADLLVVVLWGVVVGAVGPSVQTYLMRTAGTEHRRVAGALMPVAMNLGIALGAGAGSVVVDRVGLDLVSFTAVVPAALAAAGFLVMGRVLRSHRESIATSSTR